MYWEGNWPCENDKLARFEMMMLKDCGHSLMICEGKASSGENFTERVDSNFWTSRGVTGEKVERGGPVKGESYNIGVRDWLERMAAFEECSF